MLFRNAFLVFLLLAACTTNAAAKTFAYFQFDNRQSTKLLQCEVDEKGRFKPLDPEIVKLDNHYHEPMIVHPSGRFAYFNTIFNSGQYIALYSIKPDGALKLVKRIDFSKYGAPLHLAIDRTGKYAYAGVGGDVPLIVQLAVDEDGNLSPLKPSAVKAKDIPSRIAIHPTKPFLYVNDIEHGSRDRIRYLLHYKINPDGTLSPVEQSELKMEGRPGDMVFTKDGKRMFSSDVMAMYVYQFDISNAGRLKMADGLGYDGYDVYPDAPWSSQGFRGEKITISPSGTCLIITDNLWGGMHKFNIDKNGKLLFDDSYWTREYDMVKDKKFWDDAREEVKKTHASEKSQRLIDRAIMEGYYTKRSAKNESGFEYGLPFLVAFGPDETLYALLGEGIAQYKLKPDGSLEPKGWAHVFPKGIWENKIWADEKGKPSTTGPTGERVGLFIVERKD